MLSATTLSQPRRVPSTRGPTWASRVDGEAHASETSPAVTAASARNIERYRHDVSLLDMQHVAADFNHFAGDFVAEDEAWRGGGTAAYLARQCVSH